MTTANEVRGARARLGWTQQQLADALGNGRRSVNIATVARWEQGVTEAPPYLKLALERLIELHAPTRGPGRPRKRRQG